MTHNSPDPNSDSAYSHPSLQPDLDPLPDDSRLRSRRTFLVELLGVSVLVVGLLGYSAYLMLEESPPLKTRVIPSPKPSPRQTPTPRVVSSLPSDALFADASADLYPQMPKTGIYYATNPLLNSSRREIASNQGRFCIQILQGPIAQSGYQQGTVSSLSLRSDGIYVDATEEKLTFDRTFGELQDSKGRWQLLEGKPDRTGLMEQCLMTNDRYVQQFKGEFIKVIERSSL